MLRKYLAVAAFATLAACAPSPQPAPPAAAEPPPPPPVAQAPVAQSPTPYDRNDERIREQERKLEHLKRDEAAIRQRNQAAQNAQYAAPPPPPYDSRMSDRDRQSDDRRRAEADRRERDQVAQNSQYAAPPPPCMDCGVVAAIRPVRRAGDAGLVGTLGGAAAGGLVGNQFGKGQGNTAMTVVGVLGGALAGREVEKQVNASTVYEVTVNMEAGGARTVNIDNATGLAMGTRVHVNGSNLLPY